MSGPLLPPVLMGEARQQQQVVLCWDTRTTQPCTPLVTGVCVGGCVCSGEEARKVHVKEKSAITNFCFINMLKDQYWCPWWSLSVDVRDIDTPA